MSLPPPEPQSVRARSAGPARLGSALAAFALLAAGAAAGAAAQGELYSAPERGDLTAEESAALASLVSDFGFGDLARLWIDSRIKNASSAAKTELEWARDVDLRRLEGDLDGSDRANQELAKKYPNHPRAKLAELDAITASLARAIAKDLEAHYEADSGERAKLFAERDTIYRTEVLAVLETNIARLGQEAERKPDDPAAAAKRDQWEHYRLKTFHRYGRMLPEGSDEAKAHWQRLVDLAKAFVDTRFENFVLQYEAQLILGQALAALGRSEEAARELDVIIEIEPTVDPPFDPLTVQWIRRLRLQALQGTAEAWNHAGQPERAVEVFDRIAGVPQPHFPWRMDPEDPELLPFVVSMEVEEALARLAGGVRQAGLAKMRALIDRFDSESFRKADPVASESYLLEIAAALARAIDIGISDLPAELYYRAAIGYKGFGNYDAAIRAAQLAIDAGSGVPGEELWVASSLFEIGQGFDSLDLPEAAALAFQSLALDFMRRKDEPRFDILLAEAAQNWFAIANELATEEEGPWVELSALAQQVFTEVGRGGAAISLLLQKAAEKELQGQFQEARELFLSVPSTIEANGKSERVADHYRARAGAARCRFRAADSEGRAAEELPAVVAELEPLIASAHAERDAAGEAVLRFELASAHWDDSTRDRAKALAALEPVLAGDEKNPFREAALLLGVDLHAWGNPADPADPPQPARAEPLLAELRSDFAESISLPIALYALVEANQAVGGDAEKRRAAELALEYTRHPAAKFAESDPAVKLTVAGVILEGGLHKEAKAILDQARSAAKDDPLLQVLVNLAFARAGNAAGEHRQVLEGLNELIGSMEAEVQDGSLDEGPYLLYERAMADLGLYEKDRDHQHLARAESDLYAASAILLGRRSASPKLERDFWNCFLQYLLVLEAEDRCEAVLGLIEAERLKRGSNVFAPPGLQERFDKLERDCKQ